MASEMSVTAASWAGAPSPPTPAAAVPRAAAGKRRFVVCADGTWNEPAETDDLGRPTATNVAKLAMAVAPVDAAGVSQIVFYHTGVGERGGLWDRLAGGAFGIGISRNILDLYASLISNYNAGDEIWLFGFSRGAYTVRSLAGLVRHCGLLKRQNLGQMYRAYAIYRDEPKTRDKDDSKDKKERIRPDTKKKIDFRRESSWPAFNFRFMGVWDTVGSLGIPLQGFNHFNRRYQFHNVELGRDVDFAYQALAIDEQRGPFKPAIWEQEKSPPAGQVLQQAWFPGVHRNVGGGYGCTGLSDGALAWMSRRAVAAGLALSSGLPEKGDPTGEAEDSLTLLYKLLFRRYVRVLGEKDLGREGTHASVGARREVMKTYGPANLLAFLGRTPVPPTYIDDEPPAAPVTEQRRVSSSCSAPVSPIDPE